MNAETSSALLDVSRLLSRLGAGPLTGIDRVERAYLRELAARPGPLWLLARTSYGYLLLPKSAASAFDGWLDAPESLPGAPLLDRLRGRDGMVARAEKGLRGLAEARSLHSGLESLGRRLPKGCEYYSIGHSGLDEAALVALKSAGLRINVMIHDTIPLDHPELTRAGQAERFRAKIEAVSRHADRVIAPSASAAADVAYWCENVGRVPVILRVPLGVDLVEPALSDLAGGDLPEGAFFLALGTIEPRKNLGLLLDAWDLLASDLAAIQPTLCLVGRRGWESPEFFARLEREKATGKVREYNDLSDGAVATLMQGARALLMPSRAEGFGLPVAEALGRGVPVIAAPLVAYHEFSGDHPIFLAPDDAARWALAIRRLGEAPLRHEAPIRVPDWKAHFNRVLDRTL